MKRLAAALSFMVLMLLGFTPVVSFSQVTQICDTQTVPAGHVIIKRYTGPSCPGVSGTYQNATLDIQPPVSPMAMCSESPYPSGFVITQHLTTNNCWNLALNQHTRATWTIRTPTNPDHICTNSPIPTGYVIKQTLNDSNCFNASLSTSWSSYDIKIPGQQETICSFSPIPAGYTVIQLVTVPNCVSPGGGATGSAYVIKRF